MTLYAARTLRNRHARGFRKLRLIIEFTGLIRSSYFVAWLYTHKPPILRSPLSFSELSCKCLETKQSNRLLPTTKLHQKRERICEITKIAY